MDSIWRINYASVGHMSLLIYDIYSLYSVYALVLDNAYQYMLVMFNLNLDLLCNNMT